MRYSTIEMAEFAAPREIFQKSLIRINLLKSFSFGRVGFEYSKNERIRTWTLENHVSFVEILDEISWSICYYVENSSTIVDVVHV